MSLKFFYVDRFKKNIEEMRRLRYRNIIELEAFIATPESGEAINQLPIEKNEQSYNMKKGDFWQGRDDYIWLTNNITIPKEWANERYIGYFDLGKTGSGNNSGFEALLYINGEIYQGIDSNHKEILLDAIGTDENIKIDIRLWSGLEGGGKQQVQYHQLKEAFIACLDQATDDLYYTGSMIIKTIEILDEKNYVKHQLEKMLIETMKKVDFTNNRSQAFYDSVKIANDYINNQLDKIEKKSEINISCVGHTHIDVAWLWRLKHTREKVARSFSTVDKLMAYDDDYIFLQTQPQLYDYIKNDFPEVYSMIKRRVAEGKWEPSGAMWVEADSNIPSGESLIRQLLYGKKFFKKEFNYENTFLWLPDVFGYSWALPQILKKSNIDTFITTKISWNEHNKLPYDTFMWKGIDGTKILTHFITTPEVDEDNDFYTYNGQMLPETVEGSWEKYSNKDLNSDLILAYGYGDGGGGVNRDMLENRRRLDKIPGLPNVKMSNVSDYLKRLHSTIEDSTGYVHTWDDELYLEYHRGTYTSQSHNKKMNRLLELKYREAEILQTMAALAKSSFKAYCSTELELGWKIILRNQFHDIIPGSSIKEVYEDSRKEYDEALGIVNTVLEQSYNNILSHSNGGDYSIFNSYGWEKTGLVKIAIGKDQEVDNYYEDEEGIILPMQKEGDYQVVAIKALKPFSFMNITCKKGKVHQNSPFEFKGNSVESHKYFVEWNKNGHITKLFDKKSNREVLAGKGNVIEIFEDKPRKFDAWELEPTIDLKKDNLQELETVELISDGCNYIKILFVWHYNKTTVTQHLVLYNDLDRIDFETTVDWQEREKLMKVSFPVNVRSTKARYDIQFGSIERPTHRNTSWDHAKFEVVGHQWADLSEKGFGVSLLNNCKYGYDIKDNVMRLSLLKSSMYPDPEADKGIQQFTYSLYVHEDEWYESNLIQEAWDLNNPFYAIEGKSTNNKGLFDLLSHEIIIDTVKKSEDNNHIIVRFHEPYGGKTKVDIRLNFHFKGWYEVDLMENKIGEVQTGNVNLPLNPYEIKTVLVELE